MSQELVRITVDGRTVEVPKGMLLVEAAKLAGVHIPVFCHHPKLEPAGVCRMCLVEVEGQRKPVTACTLPVSDGLVVHTQTDTVAQLRKGVLELLLLNHPLDCPVCDKGGECPLQDQTYMYGPTVSRSLDPKKRKPKAVDLGNFIVLDRERCILCRRCTRFDAEVTQENNLVIAERADGAVVTTATGERYNSYFSGNTIELCPVGALTSPIYRFKARPWDLAKVPSVCAGCSVGCNTRLDFRFGELLRIVSREHPEVDGGWLCDRGRFNYRFVHAETRVDRPLLRVDGKLAPVTWSRALSTFQERVQAALRRGPQAVGVIGGGRLTNEEAYLLQKLARAALGTNNVDYRVGRQVLASHGAYPARITDLDRADAIVLVDTLLAERAPVLDLRVRRRGRKGGRVVSVGSVHGAYRFPVTRIDALPGEIAAALDRAAAELEASGRIVFVWGGHDAAVGRALHGLLERLAQAGKTVGLLVPSEQANMRGAEWAGVHPDLLPGGRLAADEKARAQVERVWGRSVPAAPGLDTEAMLRKAAAGELDVLLLVGANLKQTYPDGSLVEAALAKVPFLVCVDLFVTETAEHADLVLPAAPFPAKEGAYTTLDGLVQAVQAATVPDLDTRTDLAIIASLAEALQVPIFTSLAELRQEMAALGYAADGGILPGLGGAAVEAVLARAASYRSEPGAGLVLIPVERLFAGGGTSRFDGAIQHARPAAEALLHPEDAAARGVREGDTVTLERQAARLVLRVRLDRSVVRGTVQVPAGLPGVPINEWVAGGEYPRVEVSRRVMEEVV